MRLLVEGLLDRKKPVCVLDPKGDWWGLKSSADGKSAGYPVVIFGGSHADVPINEHSGKAVAELVATGNRPCIIDLKGWMVGPRTRFFVDFASAMFTLTRGIRWLVIDEVHNFAPQGKVLDPDSAKMLHWANRLVNEGAGMGLLMLSASQRPQKVHKDFVTANETLIAKRVIHKLDRDAVKDWIDGCADPQLGKDVIASLANMDRTEGWVWSPEIKFGPVLLKFPLFKTYDSFKPQQQEQTKKLEGWADVDLAEVGAKMEKFLEKEKANDPSRLKAEVAKLTREVATLKSTPVATVKYDPLAEQRGYDRARADALKDLAIYCGVLENLKGDAQDLLNAITTALTKAYALGTPTAAPVENKLGKPTTRGVAKALLVALSATERAVAKDMGVSDLSYAKSKHNEIVLQESAYSAPQKKVMRALAMWLSIGHATPSREMVAAVAGYSPSSGGFGNLLGSLKTVGAIDYPMPGHVTALANGMVAPSREDGCHMLWANLSNPQRKIVHALIGHGGSTRAELGADTGYSPSSGGFGNLLGSLRTLGIIDYPTSGTVVMSDWAQELLAGMRDL